MTDVSEIKILVCEDDVFFQRILQKRLTSEGYKVLCASDGRDGMKAIVTFEPDLVISDWMMPYVDGLELCQSVKTGLREAAPYFILLTAKGEINDRLLALETGADDYLVKPCDQGELMARVRSGLRNVALVRSLRSVKSELEKARGTLDQARDEIRKLVDKIPLCPTCKKVKTPAGEWVDIDRYLEENARISFARDACPTCAHEGHGHSEAA